MEARYGKVLVLQRHTAEDGQVITTSKLLESTYFSNIDFKWYDSEGNLSPLYEKYLGKPFAVQFNFNQKDKNGQEVDMTGKNNLPYKLGEIGHQDFESVEKATEEMAEFWRNRGILSKDGENIVYNTQAASAVAAFCPGWKISDIKTLHLWMDPVFVLDDHMDKSASQKEVKYKTSNLFWSAMSKVIEGKPIEFGEKVPKLSEIPEQFLIMVKGIQEVRKSIVEKKGDPTPVIQAFKDFHQGVSLETCFEWKQKQKDPASKLYVESQQLLRDLTVGITTIFEVILLDKGIQISENVRESFLFKAILNACSKHVSLVNDIVSLKKEMGEDSTPNLVLTWHQRDGLSLHDACQKAVDRVNLLEKVVNENGELLTQFFGKDGAEVFNGCKDLINGNVQWHGFATRYHSEFKYDCIVEI